MAIPSCRNLLTATAAGGLLAATRASEETGGPTKGTMATSDPGVQDKDRRTPSWSIMSRWTCRYGRGDHPLRISFPLR